MLFRSAIALSTSVLLCAQAPPAPALSLDSIMRGPALYGHSPRSVRWSVDGSSIFFEWKQAGEPLAQDFSTYTVKRDGTGLRKLSDDEARLAPPAFRSATRDEARVLSLDRGDIVLWERDSNRRRVLTRTAEIESNPRFSRDERKVLFVRSNNLFALSLDDASLEQLTDIRSSPLPPEPKGTESQQAVKKNERALLEVVEERAKKREADEARRKRENPRKPFATAARQSVTGLLLSPAGNSIAMTVGEAAADSKTTSVPNYVTESGYTDSLPSRAKVGDSLGRSRVGLLSVETGEVKWVETGIEKPHGVAQPLFSEDGSRLVVTARSQDNKDRWILAVDPATGKCRTLVNNHDDAWIGGPGAGTLGWLGDGKTLYFQSERDGWSHLYTVEFDTGTIKQITSGAWEVDEVQLSKDKQRFFLLTSEGSPHERHFYTVRVEGGVRTRVTSLPGLHDVTLSPDESALAVVYSYANKPPELYVMKNEPGVSMTRVTTSPSAEFSAYPWIDPPIVQIPARDGASVPARLYKPAAARAGAPAVIFVHGAGYLQNVHRGWSSYGREFMFHHLLMERGYIVVDLDYRASAGYGRDWRTAIYRHMGGKDLDDQVDAARWLVKEHGVNPKRIGIYGGSYGGFITLMALFTQPGVFAAGAALRPVTDWAHYNHPYTSGILNTPQKDDEAYRRSSPIFHAAGLRDALLICHGMVDVNVHFQDTVRLVQKLIELRKENWELAVYPVEDHGFTQPSSWTDEYKRILKLFEVNLREPALREAAETQTRPRGGKRR